MFKLINRRKIHIAFIIGGGKQLGRTAVSSQSGRGLSFDKQHNCNELVSCHAERHALLSLSNQIKDSKKWKRKCKRYTLYSIGMRLTLDNKIVPYYSSPCRSCVNMMCNVGINTCIFSHEDGRLEKVHVPKLLTISNYSFGTVLLQRKKEQDEISKINNIFTLFIQTDETYKFLETQTKLIEGRLWKGVIRQLKMNQIIIVKCYKNKKKMFMRIKFMRRFKNWHSLLSTHNHKLILPTSKSVKDGVKMYHQYYSEQKEHLHGVVAIGLEKTVFQEKKKK